MLRDDGGYDEVLFYKGEYFEDFEMTEVFEGFELSKHEFFLQIGDKQSEFLFFEFD